MGRGVYTLKYGEAVVLVVEMERSEKLESGYRIYPVINVNGLANRSTGRATIEHSEHNVIMGTQAQGSI